MQKKLLVNIDFNKRVYYNITNKNFVWCCDLLILKNYKEFEKVLKREYLSMDNGTMIIDVVNSNDVEHLKYILDYVEIYDIERVLFYCLPKGFFNIVDYILNNNPEFDKYGKYIDKSFMSNSLEFYNKYIKKCKYFSYDRHFLNIVGTGNIKFVKKFISKLKYINNPNYIDNNILFIAVTNGNIEIIKYLISKNMTVCQYNVLYGAVLNGNIQNIEYLLLEGYKFHNDINNNRSEFGAAIYKDNFEILDWLLEKGCTFGPNTFDEAAEQGNLKIMKWLLQHECKFGGRTFYNAIEYGNIKILEWLVYNGCEIIKDGQKYNTSYNWKEVNTWCENNNMHNISQNNYLNSTIKYSNNYNEIKKTINTYNQLSLPFNKYNFKMLIENNRLNVIKLLRGYRNNIKNLKSKVYQYSDASFNFAVIHGNIEMLKWMLMDGLKYEYYQSKFQAYEVNPVLKKQVKNILKDFLEENNIKIYK